MEYKLVRGTRPATIHLLPTTISPMKCSIVLRIQCICRQVFTIMSISDLLRSSSLPSAGLFRLEFRRSLEMFEANGVPEVSDP